MAEEKKCPKCGESMAKLEDVWRCAACGYEEEIRVEVARGWQTLWKTEDWWAVWMAFIVIIIAAALYYTGGTLKPLAVYPPKWSFTPEGYAILGQHFAAKAGWYFANFIFWLVVFTISSAILGFKPGEFVPAFIFVYIFSILIAVFSANETAHHYNLEAPLFALIVGLIIGNMNILPRWMDAGFRVEYYIKTGIVLLGATLPFTLIIYAGPVAFIQATVIAVSTFVTIYFVGTKVLGMDRRFASVLGAGGAVCGVSASIAMSAAVRARKEHAAMGITTVIVWAIIMIFVLPLISRALILHPGVAGAWIGTSEFADAAGFAAAAAYGSMFANLPPNAIVFGTGQTVAQVIAHAKSIGVDIDDIAIRTFTLMKVIGRDIWIGLWAFVMAIIATTRWEVEETGQKPSAMEIWWRFPKFVLGFFAASLFITILTIGVPMEVYTSQMKPLLVAPIKTMRTWTFIFTFFSIGLTTRFRELAATGKNPWIAFSSGAIVNVILGALMSIFVLGWYWSTAGWGG